MNNNDNNNNDNDNDNNNSPSSIIDNILYGEDYEDIQVIVRLKRNIALVGRLIAYHQNMKSFDEFVSDEIKQTILGIGPDLLKENQSLKEYAKRLLKDEDEKEGREENEDVN